MVSDDIKFPQRGTENQWLNDLTKGLREGKISLDSETMFSDKPNQNVNHVISNKLANNRFEPKNFDKFINALSEKSPETAQIYKNTKTAQILTHTSLISSMVDKEGVKEFEKKVDKELKSNPGFTFYGDIFTSSGKSNSLSMYFEQNKNVDKVNEVIDKIIEKYHKNLFEKKEVSMEEFHHSLQNHKKFNFMNAGFGTMLGMVSEKVAMQKDKHVSSTEIETIDGFKRRCDILAMQMQEKTGIPIIAHYATAPDYLRDVLSVSKDHSKGIGLEAYLDTMAPDTQKKILNQQFKDTTPLEMSALAHQTLKKTGKNDLTKTMEVMIERGATPTPAFYEILEEKGEQATIDRIKQKSITMELDNKNADIDKIRTTVFKERSQTDKIKLNSENSAMTKVNNDADMSLQTQDLFGSKKIDLEQLKSNTIEQPSQGKGQERF